MVCYTNMQDTEFEDTALSSACKSKEDSAAQTPRSVSTSDGESSTPTPRSPAKSDSRESDDESDGAALGESSHQEDEYAAFLRELAGSFEATTDDESETESEYSCTEEDEEESLLDNSGSPAKPSVSEQKLQHVQLQHSRILRRSSADSVLSTTSGAESVDVDDRKDSSDSVLTPRRDFREPVEDDYDVVQATLEFARTRPGTWLEKRREDLRAEIQLKEAQARNLLGLASKPGSDPNTLAHYARVRADLLREVKALELELGALDKEEHATLSSDSGAEAIAAWHDQWIMV